jgi:hypothetical protein
MVSIASLCYCPFFYCLSGLFYGIFFCQDFDEIHGTIFSSFFLLNGERLLFGLNGGHVIVLLVLAIDDA